MERRGDTPRVRSTSASAQPEKTFSSIVLLSIIIPVPAALLVLLSVDSGQIERGTQLLSGSFSHLSLYHVNTNIGTETNLSGGTSIAIGGRFRVYLGNWILGLEAECYPYTRERQTARVGNPRDERKIQSTANGSFLPIT